MRNELLKKRYCNIKDKTIKSFDDYLHCRKKMYYPFHLKEMDQVVCKYT